MKEKVEVLITANEYLFNLEKGIEQIIDYIENGNEVKACELIADASEGIGWIIDVVKLTKEIHRGVLDIGTIEENIVEIVEALESEDYILVGDLFNYEVLPILEKLHKEIEKIIKG